MNNKCDTCKNARSIISENGLHYICGLTNHKAMNCIRGERDYYEDSIGEKLRKMREKKNADMGKQEKG